MVFKIFRRKFLIRKRIIPILQIDNGRLVKTRSFRNPVYLGDPLNTINIFNSKCVDEILILDITSRKHNKPLNFKYLERLFSRCFMPVTYGGAIKSLTDIEKILYGGAEKVVLDFNSSASLVKNAVDSFASSTISLNVNLSRTQTGDYQNLDYICQSVKKLHFNELINQIEQLCPGEVILTDFQREGTLAGYDIKMMKDISSHLSMPVIANGGCNSTKDLRNCISQEAISAAGVGAFFSFIGPYNAVLPSYVPLENLMDESEFYELN